MDDSGTSNGIEMTTSRKEREEREKAERLADPIQSTIGAFGLWHLWVCGIIFLLKFPVAWHQMAIIFLAPPANFTCILPETADKCSSECQEIDFDRSTFSETIITQWHLVCNKEYLASLSQTIFMLGILLGNMLFGVWADKYGRRMPLVAGVILQLVSGVASAFTPWFWLFCVMKFLSALATGGTMLTSFVLIMEIVGIKWRELVGVLYQIPFNLGHLTLPLISYYIRDWRWVQVAISLPSIILISYYWLLPESPRYLLTAGKVEECTKLLEKAAKTNKRPTENIRSILDESIQNKNLKPENEVKPTILDLFLTPNLRKKTICISFSWFVCGMDFFGVAQYMGRSSGNIFINVAIGAVLMIPGSLISIPLMKYLGRKFTIVATNILTGLSMLAIAALGTDLQWVNVTLSSAGLIGMSVAFPTVYIYAGELYPTVVRNVGIGLSSTVARIGAMIAPFIAGLSSIQPWLPPFIFGIIPVIGFILVFLLPETKGQALPETIDDGEAFGKKKNFKR